MSRVNLLRSLVLVTSSRFSKVSQHQCHFSSAKFCLCSPQKFQKNRIPSSRKDLNAPAEASFTEEDLQFVKNLKVNDWAPEVDDHLPDPPDMSRELEPGFEKGLPKSAKDEEAVCTVEEDEHLPPLPPNLLEYSEQLQSMEDGNDITNSPEFQALMNAVNRACDLSQNQRGPMALHELANRSIKVKELVKLGVDLWRISARHGDLERLLHLNWETQIKPHIRFLVDIGIEPEKLGWVLSYCTSLLWTSTHDLQVRINYLESKGFTDDMVKHILNEAPFWLSLSTRALDYRLGYFQKAFLLSGNEVRQLAVDFPAVVSNPSKWRDIVNLTKLLERQFGFSDHEQKQILLKNAPCLMNHHIFCNAFHYLHHEVGLSHSQLASHAKLLSTHTEILKPRHQFLKFLQHDEFDPTQPGYVSPDHLWQGTEEEFCQNVAKRSMEDYELFLRTL